MSIKHSLKTLKRCFIVTKKPPYSYNPKILEQIGLIIMKHGSDDVENVFLCGSRARGKNTLSSDYDIGVVARRALARQTLMAIEADIRKTLVIPCHIIDINQKPEDFRRSIYDKPIVNII